MPVPVPQGLEIRGGVLVVGALHGVELGGGGGLDTLANASCRWSSETWSCDLANALIAELVEVPMVDGTSVVLWSSSSLREMFICSAMITSVRPPVTLECAASALATCA